MIPTIALGEVAEIEGEDDVRLPVTPLMLRRVAATLSALLLLQLMLLGGGTGCAMKVRAGHDAASAMTPTHAVSSSHAVPHGCEVSAPSGECGGTTGTGPCAAMTSCTAAIAAAPAADARLTLRDGHAELPEPASIRSGPAAAPELPPPRA